MASLNEILPGQLFLGDLAAARSREILSKRNITHILSVCKDYDSTGKHHLVIPVTDSHYENLLIWLPEACKFIADSIDNGGVVLVHCQMGMSRSAAVVTAYLMMTRGLSLSESLRFIKQYRPNILPNEGFMRQLKVFAECGCHPSLDKPAYVSWKAKHDDAISKFRQKVVNVIPVVPLQLYFSSGFPRDPDESLELLEEHGITHIVTASPSEVNAKYIANRELLHIQMVNQPEKLLISLPEVSDFISSAIDSGGRVLIHCIVVSRASIMICAFFMSTKKISLNEAAELLKDSIPLFTLSPYLSRHLDVYEKCYYRPTIRHPLVQRWINEPP